MNKHWRCQENKNVYGKDKTPCSGDTPKPRLRIYRHQNGMAVLAIVAILLSVITFTSISSSQQVQQFYAIDNTKRETEQISILIKRQLREIAESLRTSSTSQTLNKINLPDMTAAIEVTVLEGEQQQPLQHFEVTISPEVGNTYYKAKFLRYPSLLRLPSSAQQFSWDNQITEWLFNRNIHDLSSVFFPSSTVNPNCLNLTPANIYWIEGNCQLDSEDVAHSNESNPLLLLIVDGNLSLSNDTHFYGLIVMLSTTGYEHALHVATNASIKGAFVSNHPLQLSLDGSLTPSLPLLKTLQAHTTVAKIIPIPGSWYNE